MFTDDERRIYKVEVAPGRFFHYDPLAVQRDLVRAAGGDLVALGERASAKAEGEQTPGQRQTREDARVELMACVRTAFALPPVDRETGEGYTEADCLRVWNAWCDWLEGEKPGAAS